MFYSNGGGQRPAQTHANLHRKTNRMSNYWYSNSWTGGSGNYYNNDNQSNGYEYGGQSFSIGNNGQNFSVNRGGFNLGYGATENSGNFRREYEPRYGEGAISNYRENYSGNFRSDDKGYGENTRNNDRLSTRGNYEQRYGENVRSTDRSTYEQRYGENDRSNDFRGGFEDNAGGSRGGFKSSFGDHAGGTREGFKASFEDNAGGSREGFKASFGYHAGGTQGGFNPSFGNHSGGSLGGFKPSFGNHAGGSRGGFKPSFGDNTRGSHCGINYNGNERHIDNDWTGHYYSEDKVSENDEQRKVEESYSSKKSIKDCLLEGSIVVVKHQRGRPKYQCLHCKITFFNEDHIEKKGHLGHVKHCHDVKACFEATVGKRGFGLNYKKVSSPTKKVKTEPYQNAYEKDYIEKDIKEEKEAYQYDEEFIEKDIKEERERIKSEVKEESFERGMTDKDLRIKQEVKLELDFTQEVAGGAFKVNNLKDDVDIKKELLLKKELDIEKNEDLPCNLGMLKEMTSQERVQNYATNQLKEEAFSDINVKKGIIKTEMDEKNVPENNEKPNIIKEESTNFAEISRKLAEKATLTILERKRYIKRFIKSLTDNSFDVELDPKSNSDNIGKKTEQSFKKAVLPNGQKPEKKPETITSGQKPKASYVSKLSENFRKQHIEGKHRPNKPVNTVADFQSGGGFKILRKSGSSKNSVVPGRHEGQIKVVTKAAIPYRETGFKRRGETGSKLFMVTAKKLNGVDTVVPEHLDGVATWENGKIRVGQEIYSQCTQQTQRYMC